MKLNVLIIGAALLLAVLVGCKIGGTDNATTNGTNTSATKSNNAPAAAPSKEPDLKEEVRNALRKFNEVPFATVKSFDAGKESDVIIEQFSAADSSYSRKAKDGKSTEVVIFGPDEFSRMNSAWEWREDTSSNDTAAKRFFDIHNWISDKYIPEAEIKADPDETINGKSAKVFKLSLAKPYPEVPSSIRIWIDKDRGLPLKIAKQRTDMPDLIHDIDLDTPVKITKPTVGKK